MIHFLWVKQIQIKLKYVVNEYIQTCKELGREPQKTFKGVFNVRMDSELHQKVYKEALKAGISLNAYIKNALSQKVSFSH